MKKKQPKQKIKLANFNLLSLDHKAVKKKFGKQLKYVGTFCIKGEYQPRAFYYNPTPDRSKNHKDYMTFQENEGQMFVSGIDLEKLKEFIVQSGLRCVECSDVIYSVYRQDYRPCKCGLCFIDGGRDYVRRTLDGEAIKINLLDGTWVSA